MAILESIAAANAAYSVIKTALGNGKETAGLIGAVGKFLSAEEDVKEACLLYTSPSPRDGLLSRMPSSA